MGICCTERGNGVWEWNRIGCASVCQWYWLADGHDLLFDGVVDMSLGIRERVMQCSCCPFLPSHLPQTFLFFVVLRFSAVNGRFWISWRTPYGHEWWVVILRLWSSFSSSNRNGLSVVVQEIGGSTFLQFDDNLLNLDDLAKYRKVFIANNKYVYQANIVVCALWCRQ